MTLDPDPRYVPEEPVRPTIRSRHSRDPLMWAAVGVVVGLLILALMNATPRSAPAPDPVAGIGHPGRTGAPRARIAQRQSTTRWISDVEVAGSNPAPGGQRASGAPLRGNISWASPSLGSRYLAIRAPRGTVVTICAATCLTLPSTDYGPSRRIRPPRIADLAVGLWRKVCALPPSAGLCRGTITVVGAIDVPETYPVGPATDVAP